MTAGLKSAGTTGGIAGRWRSGTVRLAVLGSAGTLLATGLTGCSGSEFQRNIYASEDDCALDYTARICAEHGSTFASRYLGPAYRMRAGRPSPCRSDDPGPGKPGAVKRIGIAEAARGGFGTTCNKSSRGIYGFSSGG